MQKQCWAAALLLLAGCAKQAPAPVPPSPPPAVPTPAVRDDGPVLPPEDGKGGFRTANSGLAGTEPLWHLRAGLNVGALACDAAAAPGLLAAYNSFLKARAAPLAGAYADEASRYADPRALDLHMTRLYNHFAEPAAQAGFCAAATRIGGAVGAVPAGELAAYAVGALAELEQPFQAQYARWRDYRVALAAWRAGQAPVTPPAETPAIAAASDAAAGGDWRIQLGAFTGRAAAEAAWARIRASQPGFARYAPSFEPVPDRDLVRVRVGAARDRAAAIALCATAAAAGLDCLPVAPTAGDPPSGAR